MGCIFCDIVAGHRPAKKIYEDANSIAILDNKPAAPGHILLMPKEHYERVGDVENNELWGVMAKLTDKMQKALKVNATTIAIQNGEDAGQQINHVHIHIIPRSKGDGGTIANIFAKAPPLANEQMEQIQHMLLTN